MGGLFGGLGGLEPARNLSPSAHKRGDHSVLDAWRQGFRPFGDGLVLNAKRFFRRTHGAAKQFNGSLFGCHAPIVNRSSTRTQPQFS